MQEQTQPAVHSQKFGAEGDILDMSALPYKILTVGLSDIGLVRQNNEDVWGEQPSIGLLILADGMGGHKAGEVAAKEAVDVLGRALKKKITKQKTYTLTELQELLKRAIVFTNGEVYKMGQSEYELRGMGTTLCCLLFHPQGVVLAHVGDSRIYRWRDGSLEQLTKDHSLLRDLVDQGQLNANEATDFLYKNIITKAVGTEPKVSPSVQATTVCVDDIFLMCSDGLSDLLSAKEIAYILEYSPSQEDAAQALIDQANAAGGRDNITVVIAKVQK